MDLIKNFTSSLNLYFGVSNSLEYIQNKTKWHESLINFSILIFLSIIIPSIIILIKGSFTTYSYKLTELLQIVYIFIFIILYSLLLHLFLIILKAKGKLIDTLKITTSTSLFPLVVLLVLNIIPMSLISNQALIDMIISIKLFVLFVLIFWGLVVLIRITSKIHQILYSKSFFALLLPFILLIIISSVLLFIVSINFL